MKKANGLIDRIKLGWGVALLAVVTGCVGYVGPDGGAVVGGPDVVVDTPSIWVDGGWGHGFVGHGDAHRFSSRGAASRGVAHGGGRGGGGGRR